MPSSTPSDRSITTPPRWSASCLDAGCHYIDIAETAEFLLAVERAMRDRRAGGRRACVVSGCSTIPGLVQVLAQQWADRDDVKGMRILLSMGSGNPVTPTLLFSLLRPLGLRALDGSRYFDRLVRKTPPHASPRLYGRFPSSFDATGIRLGGRVLPATLYAGLDRDVLDRILWLSAKVLPALSSRLLMRLCRLTQPLMAPVRRWARPSESSRSSAGRAGLPRSTRSRCERTARGSTSPPSRRSGRSVASWRRRLARRGDEPGPALHAPGGGVLAASGGLCRAWGLGGVTRASNPSRSQRDAMRPMSRVASDPGESGLSPVLAAATVPTLEIVGGWRRIPDHVEPQAPVAAVRIRRCVISASRI